MRGFTLMLFASGNFRINSAENVVGQTKATVSSQPCGGTRDVFGARSLKHAGRIIFFSSGDDRATHKNRRND